MYCRCVFIAKFCIQLVCIYECQVSMRVVIVVLCHMMNINVHNCAAAGGDRAPGLQRRLGDSAHPPGLI